MFGWFVRKMEAQKQKVGFSMQVPYALRREGEWVYSSCPIFDVHSQGRNEKEALDNLVEAMQLFLETCYEQGHLEQALREMGFHPASETSDGFTDEHTVEVPVALIARQHAAAHAH